MDLSSRRSTKPIIGPNGELWALSVNEDEEVSIIHKDEENWISISENLPEGFFKILGVSPEKKVWIIDANGDIYLHDGSDLFLISSVELDERSGFYSIKSTVGEDGYLYLSMPNNNNIADSTFIQISTAGEVNDLFWFTGKWTKGNHVIVH